MGSLPGAVVGGFLLGALTVALQASLPLELPAYRDAFVFAAVFACSSSGRRGSCPRARSAREIPRRASLRDVAPRACGVCPRRAALDGVRTRGSPPARRRHSAETRVAARRADGAHRARRARAGRSGPARSIASCVGMVINVIVVVGLYTFVGLSGVFSFGHMAFMAIGAYSGAILVIPAETKAFVLPDLPGFLADVHLAPSRRRSRPAASRPRVRAVLALPLTRLSGLTAGSRRSPC